MPEKQTVERARKALRAGKSPGTAASEFVRREIEHVREGKHGVRSTKQAIAIGLSEARRAGIPLRAPRRGTKASTRRAAQRDTEVGQGKRKARAPSRRRSAASKRALRRESRRPASSAALSRQAKRAAPRRRRAASSTRRAKRG